eukprot:2078422-Amphidinium_carterae.1
MSGMEQTAEVIDGPQSVVFDQDSSCTYLKYKASTKAPQVKFEQEPTCSRLVQTKAIQARRLTSTLQNATLERHVKQKHTKAHFS